MFFVSLKHQPLFISTFQSNKSRSETLFLIKERWKLTKKGITTRKQGLLWCCFQNNLRNCFKNISARHLRILFILSIRCFSKESEKLSFLFNNGLFRRRFSKTSIEIRQCNWSGKNEIVLKGLSVRIQKPRSHLCEQIQSLIYKSEKDCSFGLRVETVFRERDSGGESVSKFIEALGWCHVATWR